MRFSIVIPTWEQYGKGSFFISQLLKSIKNQTFSDYEIIISDHSFNSEIEKICNQFSELNILYFKNENKRGNSPHNLNYGLSKANGEIIKIMFQDDFFIDVNSLKIINDFFTQSNCKWLVNGCCHTTDSIHFYQYMVPYWNDRIKEGVNTISSPSVLSFINDNINYFDENLVMLMDCDYYYSLYKRYGLPCIVKNHLIANTSHEHQISKMYDKSIQDEINLIKEKKI